MARKLLIDGKWLDGTGEIEVVSPATGEIVDRVARASRADVDAAVGAARRAFDAGPWPRTRPRERARVLERIGERLARDDLRDGLARAESQQSGATIRRTSFGDAPMASRYFFHLAELAQRFPYQEGLPYKASPDPAMRQVRREPVGVCAGITPWNVPLLMACWKLGPAIALGNTIVLKPASYTPVTTLMLAEAVQECDVPPGVVNVVCGAGADVGEALASHPGVDKVSFTGSTEGGRRVMELAAPTIKRLTLELGGKSASIVLPDADLDLATDGILYGCLLNAGQACTSGTRLLVPESMHDDVVARLAARAKMVRLGDPLDMATDMGPLVHRSQQERVLGYVETGRREGARAVLGGGVPAGFEQGAYVEPTILTDVRNDMRVAREEIFGPVLCVLRYRDEDEAIAIANDTPYGLAAGVWSRDRRRAEKLATRLRAGTVWINEWHMLSDAPFGGFKQSGLGREGGIEGLMAYSETKHVYTSLTDRLADRVWYRVVLGS